MLDLVVRGGTVVDGTGAAPRPCDVAIARGRVVALRAPDSVRAARVIDATGLVVAPGFIDLHSHADLILLGERSLQERLMAAKIAQGVTTVIVGNCGLGAAPATAQAAALLAAVNAWMAPEGVAHEPLSVSAYLRRLEDSGVVLNVGTLVPHGPVRASAMGLAAGRPAAGEQETMRRSVEQGLLDGAFGLSVGLIYPPGMYSDTLELAALARVVAEHGRLFTAHVRGSSETLIPATTELLEVARRSGARVHHSHLEAVGERFWPVVACVLALEDGARAEGLTVSHDGFPYTRAATMMSAIFPPWALEGGVPALLERLGEPAVRERVKRDIARHVPEWPPWQPGGWPHNLVGAVGWDGIRVASVGPGGPRGFVGRSLAELAQDAERDPFDLVSDLMQSERGQVGQLVDEISGREPQLEPLLSILTHPAAAIVSDAEDYGRGFPHPAHAGAFARALRLGRERALGPLEDLVRRMTGYPAALIGLDERGLLRPGAHADLVVFDPARIGDRATWDEPRLLASGVQWVLINGRVAVEQGRYAGGIHGTVLRAGG